MLPRAFPAAVFTQAASQGRRVWTVVRDGQLVVRSGAVPEPDSGDLIECLLVASLREEFGEDASAIAERECRLHVRRRRALMSQTVLQAVSCARTASTMLQARADLLRIEFSAVLQGWRFCRVADSLGVYAATLGLERRRAIDKALEGSLQAAPAADADTVAAELRTLLTQLPH